MLFQLSRQRGQFCGRQKQLHGGRGRLACLKVKHTVFGKPESVSGKHLYTRDRGNGGSTCL